MEQEFCLLMQRVKAGSPNAAAELLETFGPQLIRVVRRHLSPRLRAKFDSADFVQAVWGSFFANSDRLQAFEKPEELAAFLTTLARNKVVDEFRRRLQSRKWNVMLETPIAPRSDGEPTLASSREPSPSQVAIAREQWNFLLAGQPTHHQRIVQLRYAGATYREIAEELGIDERTARRVIDRLSRERVQ
jgi:RNA polymerase sigma factor (sigma-70 family)